MRLFSPGKILLPVILFMNSNRGDSQNILADTSVKTSSVYSAVKLYHQFLTPETGLYNGSQYAYNSYYPFEINQGDPFFISKQFDTGAVFYNNVLYEHVPLLYDIVKDELLIHDPTNFYIIRLNSARLGWFTIWDHTFIRLIHDSANNLLPTGFYDLLYNGNTALYKRVSKIFMENSTSFMGINKYLVESNAFFIKKDNQYYRVNKKRSILLIMRDKKKEVLQFIKKNKLNFRKDYEAALTKLVAYYNEIL